MERHDEDRQGNPEKRWQTAKTVAVAMKGHYVMLVGRGWRKAMIPDYLQYQHLLTIDHFFHVNCVLELFQMLLVRCDIQNRRQRFRQFHGEHRARSAGISSIKAPQRPFRLHKPQVGRCIQTSGIASIEILSGNRSVELDRCEHLGTVVVVDLHPNVHKGQGFGEVDVVKSVVSTNGTCFLYELPTGIVPQPLTDASPTDAYETPSDDA